MDRSKWHNDGTRRHIRLSIREIFGTVIALTALVLPTFVITILLTIACQYLKGSQILTLLPATLLPAALALIVAAAINPGKNIFTPSLELVLAAAALIGALTLNWGPTRSRGYWY